MPTAISRLRSAVAGGYFDAPYLASDPLLAPVRATNEGSSLVDTARLRHEHFSRQLGEGR
jgi:hypothetical protein